MSGALAVLALSAALFALVMVGLGISHAGPFTAYAAALVLGYLGLRRFTSLPDRVAELFRANRRAATLALIAAVLIFPWFQLSSPYWIYVGVLSGLYVTMALGLNVVIGFAGLLDLGFVAFYAIGAYTSGILTTKFGAPFWVALPAGAIVATVSGALLGAPTLRLRHDYLALVTLGFGEIVRILANNLDFITGGPSGMTGIKAPTLFGFEFAKTTYVGGVAVPPQVNYYYLVVAAVALTVFVSGRLADSRIGRAWNAIREDEIAAEAMGIHVPRAKLLAFSTGAFFGGIAGVIFANMNTFISPESFGFFQSVIILGMVIFGGMGNIAGVTLGAVLLTVFPEKLRDYEHYRLLLFGAVLTGMMLFRPEGLLPSARRQLELHGAEADAGGDA